ncbi:MAG: FimV/HubP family polar landmark protein, partial [Pseudohongiellaceae bacterium]
MKGNVLRNVIVFSTMLVFAASRVAALGLGELKLESALNQPLQASVEILQLGNVELDDVVIRLASDADYMRFNIGRPQFLSNINFSVENRGGIPVLSIASREPVREPYLNLIIDTRWPQGRLLTEYTVLLDLPVFSESTSVQAPQQPVSPVLEEPAQADQSIARTPQPQVTPTAEPATTPAPAASAETSPVPLTQTDDAAQTDDGSSAAEPQSGTAPEEPQPEALAQQQEEQQEQQEQEQQAGPEELQTSNTDTLWDIALRVRPDNTVSVQQTMLAIQRMNPDAFIGGNINRLRSGEVLRVPSLGDIQSLGQQQAVAEVARQNQSVGAEPLAAPTPQATGTASQQGQLSVVTSDDGDDSGSGAGLQEENAELDARIAELENQLAVQQEETDRIRLEREEMNARLADLDQQIASARELITLQDLQLAQLQESLAQQAAEAEAATQAMQLAAPEPEPAVGGGTGSSLVNLILAVLANSGMLMAAAVVLIVALLVLLLLRRNRAVTATGEFDDDMDALVTDDDLRVGSAGVAAIATGKSIETGDDDVAMVEDDDEDDESDEDDAVDSDLSDIINLSDEFDDLTDDDYGSKRDFDSDNEATDAQPGKGDDEDSVLSTDADVETEEETEEETKDDDFKVLDFDDLEDDEVNQPLDSATLVIDEESEEEPSDTEDDFGLNFEIEDESGTADEKEKTADIADQEDTDVEMLEFSSEPVSSEHTGDEKESDETDELETFSFDLDSTGEGSGEPSSPSADTV